MIISCDAVGDIDYDRLMKYNSFVEFAKQAEVYRKVSSVFISNTYPVHTSVITGVSPKKHGVISNTEPFPVKHPRWITDEASIHAKTLWQAAAEKGIKTAAVLWPVTGYSKTIKYNIPEAHALLGKNQIITNLLAGSKMLQIKMFLRHRKIMDGLNQPALDNFSTACMADILREYKPGLALVHLTAYDTYNHIYGRDSDKLNIALESLNQNVETLLKASGDKYDVIIFSDHGQLNVRNVVEPNNILVSLGLMKRTSGSYEKSDAGCFIECCGGSAFFHKGNVSLEKMNEIKACIEQSEGFSRFLTDAEMHESGHIDEAFGFCAKALYCYEAFASKEKANHGYPLDIPNYKVFYMVRSKKCKPGYMAEGGSLLDIAPLAAKLIGLKNDWYMVE